MNHVDRAESDILNRFVGRTNRKKQKFVDLTILMGMITQMRELFANLCSGGSGGVPPRPPEEVAEHMKYPDEADDEYHYKLAQTAAKSKITKKTNPDGKRIKGKRLRELREKYAIRAFYAQKDSAAAQSIEDLTEYVIETRGAS